MQFQHTAARRRLLKYNPAIIKMFDVSTHSRPKAAAARTTPSTPSPPGFNTQPPEGGCKVGITALPGLFCFNTQPPEGGYGTIYYCDYIGNGFNTQPPEGGCLKYLTDNNSEWAFQHTAARRRLLRHWMPPTPLHRFNTQPPEGGCPDGLFIKLTSDVSTHSRPKAAAVILAIWRCRLDVSTHSRPKAAAAWDAAKTRQEVVSTHSRPKAAAMSYTDALLATLFQHTAARRRLLRNNQFRRLLRRFNTQPPEGGCAF